MTTTRDTLAIKAGYLFQQKGYHGVGVAEILAAAGLPKGSLYHHFPNGKSDLALAAAELAKAEVIRLIDASFDPAPSFAEGVKTFCYKTAKYFDIQGGTIGCPVSATLMGGPDLASFREALSQIYVTWMAQIAAHGVRLGLGPDEAKDKARLFFLSLEGAWNLARATGDSNVLRNLPDLVT